MLSNKTYPKRFSSFASVNIQHGYASFALDIAAPDKTAKAPLHLPHHLIINHLINSINLK